jgi:hypothetical protein
MFYAAVRVTVAAVAGSHAAALKRVYAALEEEHAMQEEEEATLELIRDNMPPARKPRGENAVRASSTFRDWSDPRNNRSWNKADIQHNLETFRREMRLPKHMFDWVCSEVLEDLQRRQVRTQRDVVCRRLAVLVRYLASTDALSSIGGHFGVAKATVSDDLRHALDYLLNTFESGRSKVIKFPAGADLEAVEKWFREKTHIRKVVGAIDCSYIHIQKPRKKRYKQIANSFFGRKGCALLLQAVVGPDKTFYNVSVGQPASSGDWNTFKASQLFRDLDSDSPPFPNGYVMLADAGYFAHHALLVPFSRRQEYTDTQQNFNYLHARGRVVVENAFGILKMRFRRFHHHDIAEDVDLVPRLVVAGCILHNLCRIQSDFVKTGNVIGHASGHVPVDATDIDVLGLASRPYDELIANAELDEQDSDDEFIGPDPDADPDRAEVNREHNARRDEIATGLPMLWVNRAQLLNRPNYYGDGVLNL